MDTLDQILENLWGSDYVQANPNKSYKTQYNAEYLAIAQYMNSGTRPDTTGYSKMGRVLVGLEDNIRANAPPPDPDPDPGDYLWDAPTLSSPITRTVTNASSSVPKGAGQDLLIVFGEQLNRTISQVEGYNDVVIDGFRIIGGTDQSSGHIVPRENTGTFFMKNGRIELSVASDAITARWRTPRLYMVNLYIEVTKANTSFHADGYQTQQAMHDELGFDNCTIVTDYQGIFQSNEVSTLTGQKSRVDKTIISRTLFKPGKQGYPATWWFKAFPPREGTDPIGLTEMYDVWTPLQDILAHVYPNGHTWKAWDGTNTKYGCFLEQKMHPKLNKMMPFVRFSTTADKVPAGKTLAGQTCSDVGVRGDGGMWCYNTVADVPPYVGSHGV